MKKVFWSLINTFFGRGFSAIFAIVIGNLLLPDELGLFISLMLVTNYVVDLAFLRIEAGVIQRINSTEDTLKRNQYYTWGISFVVIFAVIVMCAMYILKEYALVFFKIADYEKLYLALIPLVFIRAAKNYFDGLLIAVLQFKKRIIANFTGAFIQIVCTYILIKKGLSISGIIISLYLANFVSAVLMFAVCVKNFKLRFTRDISLGKDLLTFSAIIYFGSMAVFLSRRIDVLFINYFLEKSNLAIYNYAVQLSFMLVLFGASVSQVAYPKMSKNFAAGDLAMSRDIYNNCIDFSYFILSIGAFFVAIHIRYLIVLLLPEYYLKITVPFLILLSIFLIRASIDSAGATILTARGVPQLGLALNWAVLFINILCLSIFVPKYGYMGAVWANVITVIVKIMGKLLLIEYKIKTGYNYSRILIIYCIFLVLLFAGYRIENIFLKEAVLLTYILSLIHI